MTALITFFTDLLWTKRDDRVILSSEVEEDPGDESDVIEDEEKFYSIVDGLSVLNIEEIKETVESLKSLVYNILAKNKDDEFGKYKMCTHLKKEYNISVDKPIITVGSVLRDLWEKDKIVRRSSDKAGMLYKAKTKLTRSRKETYRFFDRCTTLKQIKSKTKSLIMGAVQSGKTKLIISYAYQSFLKGISTVILVLPTNENEYQIRARFDDKREYTEYMTGIGLDPIVFPDPIHATTDEEELEDLLDSTTPGIVVLLCNPSKMRRLMNIITEINTCKFNLVIDEIDSFYKSKDERKFHEPFKFLIDKARTVVGVTATIFDVVLPTKSKFVTNKNIYLMNIPDDYKGFSDLMWIELEDSKIKPDKISNSWIDSFYSDLLKTLPYRLDDKTLHPIICLHKVDRKNNDQENTQYYFKKHLPSLCSIVYNGKGIHLYYDRLLDRESLMIDDKESFIDCGVFKVKTSISRVLGWLRNNRTVKPPTHIMIISGKMADRGISFVSSDYKWHLTHELMIVPQSSTAGSLLQGVRICGRYNDDIPLHIIADKTVYEDCIRSSKTQDEIYSKAKEMITEDYMNKCIEDMTFSDEVLLKGRRLSVNEYKKIKIDAKPNDTEGEYFQITPDMYKSYKTILEEVVQFFRDGQMGEWVLRTDVVNYLLSIKISDMNDQGYKTMFENQRKKERMTNDDSVSGILLMRDLDSYNKIRWWVRYNE